MTESWLMNRTGHTTSAMLKRYGRAARSFAELDQGDMVPLDEALPELRGSEPGGPLPPKDCPTNTP
jgi:hypothetical protein